MAGQPGFFDLSDRYEVLSAAGDPLERLAAVVDFEVFRGPLVAALRRSARGRGGRPPFDPVLMFKILVLQALYSLSDEATEFQIKDRLSFQRFLGLGLDGTVPDATTVWLFRERLVQAKAIDKLFARFDAALTDRGYLAMGGQIIDATVVPGTQATQYRSREGRNQGGPCSRGLAGKAGQAPAEGSRCALEREVQQGQGEGGCRPESVQAGRPCHSNVRLQEPHRH